MIKKSSSKNNNNNNECSIYSLNLKNIFLLKM